MKFINERNTFISHHSFNLEMWYKKLNQSLFGGKLPMVPLKWTQAKGDLGVVKWDTETKNIHHLGISQQYKLTKEEVLSVLAHEMIHVWQIVNKKTDGHGKSFKEMMDKINDMGKYGIKVLTKQPMEHLKTVNPDVDKSIDFVIIQYDKDNFKIAKYDRDKVKPKNLALIIQQNLKKGKKAYVEFRETKNGIINQYKKSSTDTNLISYDLDELTFNTLVDDSKKLHSKNLKS